MQSLSMLNISALGGVQVAFVTVGAAVGYFAGWRAINVYEQFGWNGLFVKSIALTLALLLFLSAESLPFIWLDLFGDKTFAVVTNLDCQPGKKHHVYYQFKLSSILIKDVSSDGYGNKECALLKVGDTGVSYFLRNNPSVHIWGLPRIYVRERFFAGLLVAILFPVISYNGLRRFHNR